MHNAPVCITRLHVHDVVFSNPTTFDVAPGLSVLYGCNKSHDPVSTNAVGKSLLMSVVPECLFDAAPLQRAGGRGDFKVPVTGALYGFEFVQDGKTYQVQKRGANTSFKLDVFEDGEDVSLSHKKTDAQAWLTSRLKLTEAMYYTTAHLSSRLRQVGNYKPDERLALFDCFLTGYNLGAIADKISARVKALGALADTAKAAQEVQKALPRSRPVSAWHRWGVTAARHTAEAQYESLARRPSAKSLYDLLPDGFKNRYTLQDVLDGGESLVATFDARAKKAHDAEAALPKYHAAASAVRDAEGQVRNAKKKALQALECLPPTSVYSAYEVCEGSETHRQAFETLCASLLKSSKVKDAKAILKAMAQPPSERDVAGEADAFDKCRDFIDIAADAVHTWVPRAVAEAFGQPTNATLVQSLKVAATLDPDTLVVGFERAADNLAAARLAQQYKQDFPEGAAATRKKFLQAQACVNLAQDYLTALDAVAALDVARDALTKAEAALQRVPVPPTGPSAATLTSLVRTLRQVQGAAQDGPSEEALAQARARRHAAQQAYYAAAARHAEHAKNQKQRASLTRAVKDYADVQEEHEDLVLLKTVFGSKGVKAALLEYVVKQYEKGLNAAAPLLFLEETRFACKVDGGSLYILAQRKGKRVCDVGKFSGSESHAFALCHLLAMLPLLPEAYKLNYVILDEMEAPFSKSLKEHFVRDYLPALCEHVPSVVWVTTAQPQSVAFGPGQDVRQFMLTHKDATTTLSEV